MKSKNENSEELNHQENIEAQPFDSARASRPARPLPAIVRAHLVESKQESVQAEITPALGAGASVRREARPERDQFWPSLILVFDTETTADEFASLRFGTYIVEWRNPIFERVGAEFGLEPIERKEAGFFIGESLNESEREFISNYCKAHGLTRMTRREWLENVFFLYGYYAYGAVVGFNLPFDLARIATRATAIGLSHPQKPRRDGAVSFYCRTCHRRRKFQPTQESDGLFRCFCTVCQTKLRYRLEKLDDGRLAPVEGGIKAFAGGWKFVFNEYEQKDSPGQFRERGYRPPVLLKPINSHANMYRWGVFDKWQEKSKKFYAGHFLDLRTLGLALSKSDEGLRKGSSLRSFGDLFGAKVLKTESREHGGALTEAYLDYAMNDAEASLALYYAEMEEYRKHGLKVTLDHIYSGASLGKAYLHQMGIHAPPFLDVSKTPCSENEIFGFGMAAYYSGLSEAWIVKIAVPVTYIDVHSMYPAVCILQGLWDLMKAEKIKVTDATQEIIDFLKNVQLSDLFSPETWKRLPVLCLIEPQEDILPVRADYRWRKPQASKVSHRIALANVESAPPMWYTLADCLVSYIRTGKPPRILYALKFIPEGSRQLQPVSIRGGVTIDPNREDFFRALVEARDNCKDDKRLAEALKIVVNAASYGIWAEVDIEDGERSVTAFSTEQRHSLIPHGEKPGRYYFPPLAAFITGGGRFLLTMLENEIELRGGVSAFCDTDSLAIVSSKTGGTIHYRDHRGKTCEILALTWTQVDEVLHKFESLNTYRSGKPLIKLENENFKDKDPMEGRIDLHAYAIAAKRYALYVPAQKLGELPEKVVGSFPTIVKASYHTLGIVEPPRDAEGREVEGWIEELWQHIIAGIEFKPSWASQPVEFRLDISRPEIRDSFKNVRAKRRVETGNKWMNRYLASIKPFNFVAVLGKRREDFSMNRLESEKLNGVPVIAPVSLDGKTNARRWTAKNSGKAVHILPPEEVLGKLAGMSDEDFILMVEKRRRQRQRIIQKIEREGRLFTTYMTFAEFIRDYQSHHESKAG